MKNSNVSNQYCGFVLGDDYYAVPVLRVQEVVKPLNITKVPLSQDYVTGLINLRGQIVTSIDLKKMLKISSPTNENDYMNIIVKSEDSLISLVVDKILDVFEVEEQNLEETPDTLDNHLKQFVSNVYKTDKKIFILLDIEKLLKF